MINVNQNFPILQPNTHQISVSQQNFGEINLGNTCVSLGELTKFQLQDFRLKILHKVVEPIVLQILIALFAEKVNLQRGVDLVLPLETLLVVDVVVLQ